MPANGGRENPVTAANSGSGDAASQQTAAPQRAAVQPEHRKAEEILRPKSKVEISSDSRKNKNALLETLNPYLEQFKAKVLTPPPGVSPAKHKATLLIMPVLMMVVFIVFGRMLFKASPNTAEAKPKDTVVSTAVSVKSEIEWKLPEPYPTGLRDPMQKVAAVGSSDEGFTGNETFLIRGIVYSEDNPSAVIDTKIVYQGDIYKGAKIVKINIDSVEFEADGKSWTQKIQR